MREGVAFQSHAEALLHPHHQLDPSEAVDAELAVDVAVEARLRCSLWLKLLKQSAQLVEKRIFGIGDVDDALVIDCHGFAPRGSDVTRRLFTTIAPA